ncbi:MAG: plastocyanin/azurin family copper-binding protein [Candidatus Dormibacteraeota bacterium]|jgi:plastocyanin|nr:plastocyanin/azurin family copper-binding protein [Candidatus Dormibacteraeota bacterium]
MSVRHLEGARRLHGSRWAWALLALFVTVLVAGCGAFGDVGDPTDAHILTAPGTQVKQSNSTLSLVVLPKPPTNPDYKVIIYHNVNTVGEFVPESLTVPVGSTVEWIWTDHYDQHNVWWVDQELVNSPTRGAGYKWAVKFLAPGVYDYYCTLHPGMLGRVVVTG